jgi:hypothetical protein
MKKALWFNDNEPSGIVEGWVVASERKTEEERITVSSP